MVFAIDTDTRELWSFSTFADAMSECERYDVADGGWKFFADDGTALKPQFEAERRFLGIKLYEPGYDLNETMKSGEPNLITHLPTIRALEGGHFGTVDDVATYLKHRATNA